MRSNLVIRGAPYAAPSSEIPHGWFWRSSIRSLIAKGDRYDPPTYDWTPRRPIAQPEKPVAPAASAVATSIGQSLLALVVVVEGKLSAGPAVKAYQAAIRRKGEEAAAAGGGEAMEAVLRVVLDADPDRVQHRERIVDKAWSGLLGWRV